MSQIFPIHPKTPQPRLIKQIASRINSGDLIVYPTDSGYALGCQQGNKHALAQICRIRQLDDSHHFTLMCRDLSEVANYAYIDNTVFRLVKNNTPGRYTFILKATKEVPKRLMHGKRKSIGLRVPENPVAQALLEALDEPMMSTSLLLPGNAVAESDPHEILKTLGNRVDLIIDGGVLGQQPTTVVDLTGTEPKILRTGAGDITPFTVF